MENEKANSSYLPSQPASPESRRSYLMSTFKSQASPTASDIAGPDLFKSINAVNED